MRYARIFRDRIRSLVGLLVAIGFAVGSAPAQQTRPLEVDDFFELRRVQDPQLSPEGEWVAYTVTTTDLESDESETRIWMIPTSGGEPLPMTAKGSSAGRPRWSPDGRFLSFVSSRNGGKAQVWVLNRLGGEAEQLTEVEQGVSSYEWSPEGRRLALVLRDPDPDTTSEDEKKPWVIDRLQFKRDYVGYVDTLRSHVYVFDLADRSLTQVTSGDYDDSQPVWSPDGRRIAFVSNRTEEPDANSNTDLWVVPADNTDRGQTALRLTDNPGSDTNPAWSPDGSTIAYVTVTEPDIIWYATNHLAVVSLADRKSRVLTASLDRNVSSPQFAADGRGIYFELEDSGERQLARLDVRSGDLERPISGPQTVGAFSMADGNIVALITRPDLPAEVFRLDRDEVRRLTVSNPWLDEIRMAGVVNVRFPSRDGTEIEGFIYTPPGYDPQLRYPALLRIHGGPVSQYSAAFNFEAQLFAAKGYVVIMTNPRGSSGYGQDFSLAIWQAWGTKDYEDVMAGVDYAIAQGYADPDRLGVGGWSYGGILTNYVITQTDRFKAAISGASEVLYRANYGHDHYQRQWERELGLPWENAELWERLSPFNSVANIVTPTLIMGGEEDWNVPILNSEQLYQALRRLGRTTQLVVYPGEHHGIRTPTFQKDRMERYLAWYDRFLRSPSGMTFQ